MLPDHFLFSLPPSFHPWYRIPGTARVRLLPSPFLPSPVSIMCQVVTFL
ncbi:MAG: hypothetical protein AVDCRST_MAG56-2003 [uncultured Cytophagales bacterium]|uniref:Uncharacterized protein n=1 Tax=uncultured Cytophagales bacterium TaxID=158755 RepID=A0A6J4IE58_9SPHI|nr:MAG: hypothetical protein AVDCRST_MAG56-2003 [uncultured Cytophagales bacterium]